MKGKNRNPAVLWLGFLMCGA